VVHLRVIAPHEQADRVVELLRDSPYACNLVRLEQAVVEPAGDMILVDIPREEASVVLGDLKELGIPEAGSVSVTPIEVQLSAFADEAERVSPGVPADAVIWEEVEARTSEETRLSWTFLAFIVLAALIASAGIYLNSSITIVGAMVVGPEFGPIAAFCVAAVELRGRLALHALGTLAVGFPLAITAVWLTSLVFRATGVTPETFTDADHSLSASISNPDVFTVFIAFCAGIAGMLSLSTAKSGALIGVLVSVTTIPAAANIGVAFTYGDWSSWRGSQLQLVVNITTILAAGTSTLLLQRLIYRTRRRRHLADPGRARAGLPAGRSGRR
jgi:uncharacterized hydrophobic protein (TIGR00271 family)